MKKICKIKKRRTRNHIVADSGDLVFDSVRHGKPVQVIQKRANMFTLECSAYKTSCKVHVPLEFGWIVLRNTSEQRAAIIQNRDDKGGD